MTNGQVCSIRHSAQSKFPSPSRKSFSRVFCCESALPARNWGEHFAGLQEPRAMKLPRHSAFSFAHPNAIRTIVLLLLILGSVILIRTRLLDVPLERDEGEFLYCGQTILEGQPLYKCAPQCHGPGTCVAY